MMIVDKANVLFVLVVGDTRYFISIPIPSRFEFGIGGIEYWNECLESANCTCA